jgi:hypothetical protein
MATVENGYSTSGGDISRRKQKEEEGWRRVVRNFTPS